MSTKYACFRTVLLCLVIFLLGTAPQTQPALVDSGEKAGIMAAELDQLIENEPGLKGSVTGISVRAADTGEVIYDHMANTRMRPASNLKLLTTAAALAVLGNDYTFSTEVLVDGVITNNQLNGDLYLKGKGDPTLLSEDFDILAKKIKESGIDVINGDLVADDTWYDAIRLSPDVTWRDEHWYYGAQISALTASPDKDYDAGTVVVEVQPGDIGKQPKVSVTPDNDYIQVVNNAKTTATDEIEDLVLNRVHGENVITIDGTIPAESAHVKEWMAVWEPTGFALDLFKQSLAKQRIEWTGSVRSGQVPYGTDMLYAHESMPLSELIKPYMKLSNNTHAEILVKEMGKVVHGEGSWEKGLQVVETEMEKLGVNPDRLTIKDGSGLSHMNLLSPNHITRLLHSVQNERWFQAYLNALPDAGKSDRMGGGTLRYRMKNMRVQAKTGTIDGVSTLSGYLETTQGENLLFSIMLNNLLDEKDGPVIEDKLVEVMASYK